MSIYLFILSGIIISVHMVKQYMLSKGNLRVSYYMIIALSVLFMLQQGYLVIRYPDQAGILLMWVCNVWAIVMSTKGLLRLRNEKRAKESIPDSERSDNSKFVGSQSAGYYDARGRRKCYACERRKKAEKTEKLKG